MVGARPLPRVGLQCFHKYKPTRGNGWALPRFPLINLQLAFRTPKTTTPV